MWLCVLLDKWLLHFSLFYVIWLRFFLVKIWFCLKCLFDFFKMLSKHKHLGVFHINYCEIWDILQVFVVCVGIILIAYDLKITNDNIDQYLNVLRQAIYPLLYVFLKLLFRYVFLRSPTRSGSKLCILLLRKYLSSSCTINLVYYHALSD